MLVAYLEPCLTSTMEPFAKIVNVQKALTFFAKRSECASIISLNYVCRVHDTIGIFHSTYNYKRSKSISSVHL